MSASTFRTARRLQGSQHKPTRNQAKPRNPIRSRLALERLEARLLLTLPPVNEETWLFSGHGEVCRCPICTGEGLDQIPLAEVSSDESANAPLSSLPQLSSNPSATAKLFLDFDGHFESRWGSWSNVSTPVYDQDGDLTSFSSGELASIYEIWARVAEDFAPFNIDVTTIDPGHTTDRVVAVIAIGGSWSDWYGSSAGGVAYVGGFYNSAPNVGYAFENNLGNGNPKYVADAASHEAGHLFGLSHQATWSGNTLVEAYNSGSGDWAPIMGVGYYRSRTTWYNGPTSSGPTAYQDDMAILAGSSNGFGYRSDDYGSTIGAASVLPTSGTSVNLSGLIGRADDQDVWSFTTGGGQVTFQLSVAPYGANLDAILELKNSSGSIVASDAPSTSQGASISVTVGAGTYYLVARGVGDYGNVGQYTITGSLPSSSSTPEIHLSVGGVSVADGGTIDFGATLVGTAVTRTITVTNAGTATLTLSPLSSSLPAGFTLVSNLGATSLAPGGSTTFSIRLDAGSAGSFGGAIQLWSNDGDESPYDLVLSGTVQAPVENQPEISVFVGGTELSSGGLVSFGTTVTGTPVDRTITICNDGTASLSLSPLDPTAMGAGFVLVQNLGSTTLAPGESTSFVIRLSADSPGDYSSQISVASNDADENPFALQLSGSVSNAKKKISDNRDPGNSSKGKWNRTTGKGYAQDIEIAEKGSGTAYKIWTLDNLPEGIYRVWATWVKASSNAKNSPFTLFDGDTALRTARINQKVAPKGPLADGAKWQQLGTVTVISGQLQVKLSNAANGRVVADAIRVEYVAPAGAPAASSVAAFTLHPGILSAAGSWLAAPEVVRHRDAPDGIPLPAASGSRTAEGSSAAQHAAAHSALAAIRIEPEDRLLADVLDLLGEARAARSSSAAVDELAADPTALCNLLADLS